MQQQGGRIRKRRAPCVRLRASKKSKAFSKAFSKAPPAPDRSPAGLVNHAGGALLGDAEKGGERRGKMQIKSKHFEIFTQLCLIS